MRYSWVSARAHRAPKTGFAHLLYTPIVEQKVTRTGMKVAVPTASLWEQNARIDRHKARTSNGAGNISIKSQDSSLKLEQWMAQRVADRSILKDQ